MKNSKFKMFNAHFSASKSIYYYYWTSYIGRFFVFYFQ